MPHTPIRVALLGASGRMGRLLTASLNEDDRFDLVARIDTTAHDALHPALLAHLRDAPPFDILVDFSTPEAFGKVIDEVANRKCAWLLATTGLDETSLARAAALSSQQAVFVASNTSLGVALLERLCTIAGAALAHWDCEIVETHHRHKIDAPSGTALTLARAIADQRSAAAQRPSTLVTSRADCRAKRDDDAIGIASVRGGSVAGEHRVLWLGPSERLEIAHAAESREIFAQGALRILPWLSQQPPGLYGMANIVDDILS